MKKIRVAVNGTGRIGLCACRLLGLRDDLELVAINSTAAVDTLVHLLRYDSVHRHDVAIEKLDDSHLAIGCQKNIAILSERDITKVGFDALGVQLVIECTGAFNKLDKASQHLRGSVEKVIISAPVEGAPTFVYGVNHRGYDGQAVISNASCTTNALAPIVQVIHNAFGIETGLLTTVHSYTNDQNLLDVRHKDLRRARAAALNIIPTSTGAAKAIGLVIPELSGKLNGFSVRVPTPDVSMIDLSVVLRKEASKDELNNAMRAASQADFAGLIALDDAKLVSSDFIGDRHRCIFVPDCTIVVGNTAKLIAWYDNEVGYTERLLDMARYMGNSR